MTERIESWATPGFPDVFVEDDGGKYHTIELKHCIAPRVDLSPHQVSFHSRHGNGSSWNKPMDVEAELKKSRDRRDKN